MAYLYLKSFHLVFVIAWFAGLFYLPRIFVNLAMVSDPTTPEYDRLLLMARKLYRFMLPLAVLGLVLGLVLWLGYGIQGGWLQAKLILVLGLCVYHAYCGRLYRAFCEKENRHSHIWFRWFNEIPVMVLIAVVILVIVKPF